MKLVAALFVDAGGGYPLLPWVDCWDEARDARKYDGALPVVAHPPCTRWCRLAGLVEARWGYKRGEDDGCFASALASVRRCGGVLEHPAYSAAWSAHGLSRPPTGGGWVSADVLGGWTCYVEQWRYGHAAKKATWLYAFGVERPELRWGLLADRDAMKPRAQVSRCWKTDERPTALVSWCGNRVKSGERRPRLSKRAASATPEAFRSTLLSIAQSARTRAA